MTSPKCGVFDAVYRRLCVATGSANVLELAKALERHRSEVTDAIREAALPLDWLVRLWRCEGISPRRILEGTGPQRLPTPVSREEKAAQAREVADCLEEAVTLWEPIRLSSVQQRLAILLDKKIHLNRAL